MVRLSQPRCVGALISHVPTDCAADVVCTRRRVVVCATNIGIGGWTGFAAVKSECLRRVQCGEGRNRFAIDRRFDRDTLAELTPKNARTTRE